MSDKLTLSAAISVLMMSVYVVLGDHSARATLGPVGIDRPERIAISALPVLDAALTRAGTRHILY